METTYSVLMSVYHKEKPEYLKSSMESMFNQTVPTDDFVLICDGPLNESLDAVIAEMQKKYGSSLHVVRLEKNGGLGNALNEGIKYCKYELVARMDSDDISCPDRCEKQLSVFRQHAELSIVSGMILEFQDTPDVISGKRQLPETHDKICEFSRKRNPFNHPAVMFKKSAVQKAGGYSEKYPLFEDYYLWIRMLMKDCKGYNLQEPVLYMRTPPDMYLRRGGRKYAKNMLSFHKWLKRSGWTRNGEYITGAIPHAAVCVMPNCLRYIVYHVIHG